jgi:hypothetical protein
MEFFEIKEKQRYIVSFNRIQGDGLDYANFINNIVENALPKN